MPIRGGCVFRNDGDGCLSSKYVNDNGDPFVETCKLIPGAGTNDPFEGKFKTVWLESTSGAPVATTLEITKLSPSTYKLVWHNPKFEGIGMLYQGLLVCGYWD